MTNIAASFEYQNPAHPRVVWPLFCNDVDFSRRPVGRGSRHEFGAPLIGDEAKTSQGRHRTRASKSAYRYAAHLLEIEPVTGAQASLKRRGVRLFVERPLYIGDDAVVVGIKPE